MGAETAPRGIAWFKGQKENKINHRNVLVKGVKGINAEK